MFLLTLIHLNNNEPVHEISNTVVCATSKASDQPAHTQYSAIYHGCKDDAFQMKKIDITPPGGGGGGGVLSFFSSYVGSGPAFTVQPPQKISGISSTSKNI